MQIDSEVNAEVQCSSEDAKKVSGLHGLRKALGCFFRGWLEGQLRSQKPCSHAEELPEHGIGIPSALKQ